MRIPIEMANLGYDADTFTVAGWLKSLGERVERGEEVVEIETEKATVGMEALASGTLVEIVHDAGAEVRVGEVIGYLEDGT